MLLESLDLGVEAPTVQLLLGLLLGLTFGIAAQWSRFCLRRAIAGEPAERRSAAGVWAAGFAVGILALQLLTLGGLVDLGGHRWLSPDLPIIALVLGGIAFGVGMVLTRGCISRLTVLSAAGNLRAAIVVTLFAIVAHATLKGVLAPLRTTLTAYTLPSPVASLAELPGGPLVWALVLAAPALVFALRSDVRISQLLLGGLIGLLAAFGWAATSVLLLDDFDPQPVQSLAFTLPWSDGLFWTIASTSIQPGFGVGLIGGTLGGAFLSAAFRGELRLESFQSPAQTLRYASGALLMGVGGVLAGGCSVGAGLSGTATLSVAALVVLLSIVAGAKAAQLALGRSSAQGKPLPV
ncbi:YeeE/YedE family protein [Sulfitobacter sp. LCG007]